MDDDEWNADPEDFTPRLEGCTDPSAAFRLRNVMGDISEDHYAAGWLIGLEHMLFGAAFAGDGFGNGLTHEERRRSQAELYEELDFARYADMRVDRLSGGTLAKLNLALAMLPDPEVLMLDEPYAGFDWDTYVRFWDLMGRRRASGRAVLVISHFIADEERFDCMVRVRDGRTWSP